MALSDWHLVMARHDGEDAGEEARMPSGIVVVPRKNRLEIYLPGTRRLYGPWDGPGEEAGAGDRAFEPIASVRAGDLVLRAGLYVAAFVGPRAGCYFAAWEHVPGAGPAGVVGCGAEAREDVPGRAGDLYEEWSSCMDFLAAGLEERASDVDGCRYVPEELSVAARKARLLPGSNQGGAYFARAPLPGDVEK